MLTENPVYSFYSIQADIDHLFTTDQLSLSYTAPKVTPWRLYASATDALKSDIDAIYV